MAIVIHDYTVTVVDIPGGHRLTATRGSEVQTVDVMSKSGGGAGGSGADGFSPIIEITEISGGHRLTVTDVNGTESFDVLDGAAGKTAYQYAQDGGYTGSEAEFAAKMAKEIPDGVLLFAPQILTAEQQAQARENIDVVSLAETVSHLEGTSAASLELFAGLAWTLGYYNTNGTVTASLSESRYYGYVSVTQEKVPVVAGGTYNCVLRVPADKSLREGDDKSTLEITFAEYDVNGAWIRRNKLTLPASTIEGDYEVVRTSYTPASNVRYVCAATRTFRTDADGSKVLSVVNAAATTGPMRLLPLIGDTDSGKIVRVEGDTYALADMPVPTFVARNPHFIAVNHRGYSLTAPENTLSAYKLSRRMGFAYAECDVAFTSDGVAVLLHDGTVDRTSNGTGSITSLTLAEVKALDFGSWKSEEYAGETIPTFEEFIALCKRIGLHPYIELKTSGATQERVEGLVEVVERYGMRSNVTWESFSATLLGYIKNKAPDARLGYAIETITTDCIDTANGLKTEENDVFLLVAYGAISSDFITQCVKQSLPIEAWTCNTPEMIINLDPYVSGCSSDMLRGDVIQYNAYV